MIVGAAISGYDLIVNTFLWETFLRTLPPEALCLLPIAGMLLTGIILSLFRVSYRKAIPKLSASGIGAIFRAPLSGAIMGIESPYKRDLAHEALVHGLVASARQSRIRICRLAVPASRGPASHFLRGGR